MVALEGSDDEHVTVVPGNSLAECSPSHPVLALGVCLKSIKVSLEICKGVGVAVRQVHRVLIMLKLTLPGQCIVIPLVLSLHAVLIIADVISSSYPSSSSLLSLCFGIH